MLRMRKLLVLFAVVSISLISVFGSQAFAKSAKKAPDKQVVQKEEMVYATSQGKKYHKEGCRFIKNRETEAIEIKEAEEKGLVPCGKCFKIEADTEETQEEKE